MKLWSVIKAVTGMVAALTVLLVGLKLTAVLAWLSWWAVFSPVWYTWLVTAIAAFCVGCYQALTNLDRALW